MTAIVAALCALPLAAQRAGTPVRTLLVGRNETASIELSVLNTRQLAPWRHASMPLAAGTDAVAVLWTDLPVTIGPIAVPAGRHRLWTEGPSTLVVTRELPPERAHFTESDVVGRATMTPAPSPSVVDGWSLGVVTTRVAEDTLATREDRRAGIVMVRNRFTPGTRSALHLRWLDRLLTVPIAAR
jgi:hypothetical protein